jgi:hypothetical protein
MNKTERRMLAEMEKLDVRIDRAVARLEALSALLSEPDPPAEAVMAAIDELAQCAIDIQPTTTRLAFLGGNRRMVRMVTEAGVALAELKRQVDRFNDRAGN